MKRILIAILITILITTNHHTNHHTMYPTLPCTKDREMRGSINLYKARDIEAKRKEVARAMQKRGKVSASTASVSSATVAASVAGNTGERKQRTVHACLNCL